jgi:hypothetical protein
MRLNGYAGVATLILAILASNTMLQVQAQGNAMSSFSIQGWQNNPYVCWYWWADFQMGAGQEIRVQWSTSSQVPIAVDIYMVIPTAHAGRWFCDSGPEALYASGAFGSTHWVTPTTGTYTLLVVNDRMYTVSGTLTLSAGSITIPLTSTGYGSARQEPICPFLLPNLPQC